MKIKKEIIIIFAEKEKMREKWSKLQTNQKFGVLLILVFVINLIQAIFTGIHYDEVYYAIWGRNLDWGYFDHPPMVAILTYLGDLFFTGNLSIRFFTLILHLCTLTLIWFSVSPQVRESERGVWTFFILSVGAVLFSVYGFTTTPDVPLIFFTSLFLFSYRKFLEENQRFSVLLLAVAMAGMMYSKYHAVLFIGLVVLSNFKLLLNLKFWVAGILALTLIIPHMIWQYSHDFLSFKFHLIARNLGFQIKYVLEFIPGQLGVFNPAIVGILGFVLWKHRPKNDYERTLYFLIIGVIGFFAFSTIKGRAEAHWTTIASIPMIILLMEKSLEDEKVKKLILKYVSLSLILVLIARMILFTDIAKKFGYEDREPLYRAMESMAGNLPVVFNSSFQDASSYEFYTRKPATTISAIENRQTQYDFWQREQNMLGKKVLVILEKGDGRLENIETKRINDNFEGFFVEDWQVSNRLKIRYELDKVELIKGESVEIPIEIENPTEHFVDFQHKRFPLEVKVLFMILKHNYEIENVEVSSLLKRIGPMQKIKTKIKFQVPDNLQDRKYKFSVIVKSFFGHTHNGELKTIKVN